MEQRRAMISSYAQAQNDAHAHQYQRRMADRESRI